MLEVRWLGSVAYAEALELQTRLRDQRLAGELSDTALLLEHPDVITFGRGAGTSNALLSDAELRARGYDVARVNRGGDVTWHGPGQLVGYPILDLASRGGDVHAYLRELEGVLIAGRDQMPAFDFAPSEQRALYAYFATLDGLGQSRPTGLTSGATVDPDTHFARLADAVVARTGTSLPPTVARGVAVIVTLKMQARSMEPVVSGNVIAELRGSTHPEEIVVIGGHIDSWDVGQGAHDDGAGCVMAMEAINVLRRLNMIPRRTIRVVLWTNEENGLAGARQYAKDHADELANHVAAIEADQWDTPPPA